jgi:hypothetical protein
MERVFFFDYRLKAQIGYQIADGRAQETEVGEAGKQRVSRGDGGGKTVDM